MQAMRCCTCLWVLTGLFLGLSSTLARPQTQPPARTFSLTEISDRFPSRGFEPRIAFWRAVFTRYGTNEVVLHDTDDLRLIYEVVQFKQGAGRGKATARRQRRTVKARMNRLAVAMTRLQTGGSQSENADEVQQRILKVLRSAGLQPSPSLFRKLRHNIHAQRGVKERFRDGIVRSGLYLARMEAIFERHGLPRELVRLPHVESSFNYASRSRKGAAGIWQFMPRTGKAYKLRISRSIDQRRDPIAATEAAARYLKDSYRQLGNWPLAVTSYNHGQSGIARAKRRHGPNLLNIIAKYKSRSFRYASKNFYAEFLTAVEVSRNYRTYFGPLTLLEPLEYQEVLLKKAVRLRSLTGIEGLSQKVLREYNPQFSRYVWARSGVLPGGFKIRVPAGKVEETRLALAKAPPVGSRTASAKLPPDGYRVKWGDSLTVIARRFGTSVKAIQRLNDLQGTRIQSGQVLRIPGLRRASASQDGSNQKPSAGGASAESRASAPGYYRVRRGDSLGFIAKRFGTSVRAIQRMNGLRGSRINAGQVLKLPGSPQLAGSHSNAARKGPAKSGQQPPLPQSAKSQPGVYRVKRGDSLIKIARRFGASVGEIQRANGLKGSHILAGQVLKIPLRQTATAGSQPVRTASTSPAAKAVPSISANGHYRVRRGDSLATIAQKFGVSVNQLRKANAIRGHLIYPGQTLIVPGGSAAVNAQERP